MLGSQVPRVAGYLRAITGFKKSGSGSYIYPLEWSPIWTLSTISVGAGDMNRSLRTQSSLPDPAPAAA